MDLFPVKRITMSTTLGIDELCRRMRGNTSRIPIFYALFTQKKFLGRIYDDGFVVRSNPFSWQNIKSKLSVYPLPPVIEGRFFETHKILIEFRLGLLLGFIQCFFIFFAIIWVIAILALARSTIETLISLLIAPAISSLVLYQIRYSWRRSVPRLTDQLAELFAGKVIA